MRRLAYEEGTRRYGAALALGDVDRRERCNLLLALGRAAYLEGDLARSAEAAQEAGQIADELDDVMLLAWTAFVLEASTDQHVNAVARTLCERALSRIDDLGVGLQARLLGQRSHIAFYGGEIEMTQPLSEQALAVARTSGDDDALMEALRARQEALPGADGRDERAQLADEMVSVASGPAMLAPRCGVICGPSTRWSRKVASPTPPLGSSVSSRVPSASEDLSAAWLLDRCIACIAQGRGDLDAAAAVAQRASDRMRTVEPEAALGAYLAIQCAISHHRGAIDAGLALAQAQFSSPPLFTVMRRTGRALLLAGADLHSAAATEYELAGPPSTWRFPPFYVLPGLVIGALAAAALDRLDDLRTLVSRLEPFRGEHVVGGAGVVTYLGPVELHLGAFSLQLAEVEVAIDDLTRAEQAAERGGAAGYLAEARHHLAHALLEREGQAISSGRGPWPKPASAPFTLWASTPSFLRARHLPNESAGDVLPPS